MPKPLLGTGMALLRQRIKRTALLFRQQAGRVMLHIMTRQSERRRHDLGRNPGSEYEKHQIGSSCHYKIAPIVATALVTMPIVITLTCPNYQKQKTGRESPLVIHLLVVASIGQHCQTYISSMHCDLIVVVFLLYVYMNCLSNSIQIVECVIIVIDQKIDWLVMSIQ